MGAFLQADWTNIVLVTYTLPPQQLALKLPPGCTPALWQGELAISLLAFEFRNTRVRGINFPFQVHFPMVALQVQVQRGDRRGIALVGGIAPRYCISTWAHQVFNEDFQTLPLEVFAREQANHQDVQFVLWKDQQRYEIGVRATHRTYGAPAKEWMDFLRPEDTAFSTSVHGLSQQYLMAHAEWDFIPVRDYLIHADFEKLWGHALAPLNGLAPASVLLSAGSRVLLYRPQELS